MAWSLKCGLSQSPEKPDQSNESRHTAVRRRLSEIDTQQSQARAIGRPFLRCWRLAQRRSSVWQRAPVAQAGRDG